MALPVTLTNATIADADDVMENLEYIEDLAGAITTSQLSAALRVPNSNLENNDYSFVVSQSFTEAQLNDMTATDGTKMLMVCSIPYDATDTALSAYTLLSVETATFLNGATTAGTTPIFKLQIGNPTDTWANISGATGITWGSTNNTARVTVGTALSGVNFATRSYYIALVPTTAASGYSADALSSFVITLKFKRELRS